MSKWLHILNPHKCRAPNREASNHVSLSRIILYVPSICMSVMWSTHCLHTVRVVITVICLKLFRKDVVRDKPLCLRAAYTQHYEDILQRWYIQSQKWKILIHRTLISISTCPTTKACLNSSQRIQLLHHLKYIHFSSPFHPATALSSCLSPTLCFLTESPRLFN